MGSSPLAGIIASGIRCCSPAAEGTRQKQNTPKIPKSQTNQACVRHDGAAAGTKVGLPNPRGGHGSPDACLGARFQSGGGTGRLPGVPKDMLNMSSSSVKHCSAVVVVGGGGGGGARAPSSGVSLAVNPVSHHLQLTTPCFTSPQTLIINI